jgi:hypothetical protein
MKEEVKTIPIDKLKPDPLLSRHHDLDSDNDLGQSIDKLGVLNIPKVRPLDTKENEYGIIGGHSRIRELKKKGNKKVKCIVKYCSDSEAIDMGIADNEMTNRYNARDLGRLLVKRKELYLKENPDAQQWGGDKTKQTKKGFVKWYSETFGLAEWKIYEAMSVQNLDNSIEVGSEANSGNQRLPPSKAELVARIHDKEIQKRLVKMVIEKKLSLGEVSKLIERIEDNNVDGLDNIDEWYGVHKSIISHSNQLENLFKRQVIFKMPEIETEDIRNNLESLVESAKGILKYI